jgi:signal peptide peptidase SppA
MKFPHLWQQLFNTPLMLHGPTADVFADTFLRIISGQVTIDMGGAAPVRPEAFAGNAAISRFKDKRYAVTDSGVGLLAVHGVLAQRAGQISPDCTEMASYQRLGAVFEAMMADRDVQGILMEIDSPGGQVAGNFELAARIMAARPIKPVWAHANEMAFSAAYSIGSSAERLQAPQSGNQGSIGVIMQHVSQVEKDAKAGYVYTTIKSGEMKDMFNPHKPLSAAAENWAQGEVNRMADIFVNFVASARTLDAQAVRDLQAGIFGSAAALDLGLIDAVATFNETLAEFEQRIKKGSPTAGRASAQLPSPPLEENTMSEVTPAATNKPANSATPAAASVDAAAAAAIAKATAEGAQAAQTRIHAILNCEEAKGREAFATHLAFKTVSSLEDAKSLLAASPLGASGDNALAKAMAMLKNPAVGADVDGPGLEAVKPVINAAAIYASRHPARTIIQK